MALNLSAAPRGEQTLDVNFGGTTLKTFTYRPDGEIKGVLLNFHGSSRNAEGARDAAIRIADEKGLYVVAPLFEESDFSGKDYQMGGIVGSNGQLRSQDDWTISLVDDIAEWAHAKVGNDPADETIGFGHSGGAQFLSRVAAFGPDIFDKMIVANASTHVRASLSEDLPYGFGGDLSSADREAYLKDYLADPVTIYAGSADDDPNASDLATGSAAMRQGDNRLERAEFVYEEAKELAESKGWDFNWELVVADGVTHSARKMFNAPEFDEAFDGRTGGGGGSAPQTPGTQTPAPQIPAPSTSDVFEFDTASEWDGTVIDDFAQGDVFDFSGIDANTTRRGDQAFDFLGLAGSGAFTTDGAEIRVRHYQGDTYLYLNTDGDRSYEAKGMIEGIHDLTASDFLL
ncbi:alpha/beta hydrolase family protein [Paracoccus benzoatiresistens]|uniref:Alpha/beta hydrolase n=1 Tax=Paracoccus benzoatiresistens TaxID=2997341 RepID=A0ABT4J0N0_9RHOB|nr:hypothetical protein [Paracoccus sp. EF6]MCZ0960674.1 hypothetical protein [Paracoccus sp. EF6]